MTLLFLYIAGVLLAQLLVVLLVWWAHLRFWRWRLQVERAYDHVEQIALPDGGRIELRRLTGTGVPVLLVHGLAMNHRNQDIAEEVSFARHLRAQGRDVWLLTLRSGRTHLSVFGQSHSHFSAMVKHDFPVAVNTVLARTGQAQLDLAGFSMGGMLVYATLGRTVQPAQVRRVALFASPAKVRPLGLLSLSRVLPYGLSPSVPMRLWTRSLAFAPRWISALLWRQLYNAKNVERAVERNVLWNVWEDIPGRLGSDFVRWSAADGVVSVDGAPILDGLSQVAVPVCFFAGSVDWLAPAWTVRAGFDAWGSALPGVDKHLVLLGREHGTRNEYGHCDIAFGKHVREEVFEPAGRFLATGLFGALRTVSESMPAGPAEPAAPSAFSAAE
jgi:polyhydroxyalkanoate synthase subunit PhaC